ncbi:hypothetical protein QAD02_009743 [Eretmocerus hayati]|uniref:Uncharacterized protein n=1 Tax=Eretmocerus hayati TaxID=131215 RepID=A0ACC2NA76_9HYME|nr:hypothetical protein QAD02_009743 [Eretmocerus hayati]
MQRTRAGTRPIMPAAVDIPLVNEKKICDSLKICSIFQLNAEVVVCIFGFRPRYDNKSCFAKTGLFFEFYWKTFVLFGLPALLIPVVSEYDSMEVRCAGVVILMAIFWMTECLPLPVTSLLPLVLFPSLGILDTEATCKCYMNDTIMVFLGGLILAIAIEHSNLHLRIALGIMMFVGCSHRKLLAGLLVVIQFLGMWISNTACAAMMVPIVFAVLTELEKEGLGRVFRDKANPDDADSMRVPTTVTQAYLLATAYASTFAGVSTLVGTGTNLVLKGIFEAEFPHAPPITFTRWMIWALPQSLLNLFLTWLYVLVFYMGMFRPNSKSAQNARIGDEGEAIANRVMEEKFRNLGSMNFHEAAVSVLFFTAVILWLFRQPGFITGWAELIAPNVKIKDSVPIILVAVLMFVIPKEPSFFRICSRDANKRPTRASEGLITWKVIEEKMPWSLMFLLGGGFAISKGSNSSGLSQKMGLALSPLRNLPPYGIMCLTCWIVGQMTEFTSNIGVANIMLPVIAQLSKAVEINPLYLMLPATITCSYAFRLPSGTPPNAIITVAGQMPPKSLFFGGCLPSLYGLFTTVILFPIWGTYVWDIDGFPLWATNNETSVRCLNE